MSDPTQPPTTAAFSAAPIQVVAPSPVVVASSSEAQLGGAIDDYLLGIADGLQRAQRQLSQMGAQAGDQGIVYQIPRVDFELKMTIDVLPVPAAAARTSASNVALRFRPAPTARGSQVATETVSVIRGAFVAVPVRGGKPPPVLRSSLRQVNRLMMVVTVSVQSAVGEKLAGVLVNFNVDRDLSSQLSVAKFNVASFDDQLSSGDQPKLRLAPGTGFQDGLVETNADGIATGVLTVDAAELPGTRVAMIIDVLGMTETIVYVVPAAPGTATAGAA